MRKFLDVLITVAGLVIAILALAPSEWNQRFSDWRSALSPSAKIALTLMAGFALGAAAIQVISRKHAPRFLDSSQYESDIRSLITSGKFHVIKVFGYTGETVLNDLIRFEDRYRGDLELRLLHRSWLVEAEDEAVFNRSDPPRRWDKAAAIQRLGKEPWIHPLKRQVKYYSHQPIIKGVILCRPRGEGRIAFITFYHWLERASEGGSPFKGANMHVLSINDDMPGGRQFIDYVDSQFDYEWKISQTVNQLEVLKPPVGATP